MTATDRFWAKVDKDGPVPAHRPDLGPCWVWTGARAGGRYGYFAARRGIPRGAHRISWEFANGPIPPGLYVLHRCDNPPCVNPAHLFLGTQSDNLRDCFAKGRGRKPPKLAPADLVTIQAEYAAGGVLMRELAGRYGITKSYVSRIVNRSAA